MFPLKRRNSFFPAVASTTGVERSRSIPTASLVCTAGSSEEEKNECATACCASCERHVLRTRLCFCKHSARESAWQESLHQNVFNCSWWQGWPITSFDLWQRSCPFPQRGEEAPRRNGTSGCAAIVGSYLCGATWREPGAKIPPSNVCISRSFGFHLCIAVNANLESDGPRPLPADIPKEQRGTGGLEPLSIESNVASAVVVCPQVPQTMWR